MNYEEYKQVVAEIVDNPNPPAPYNDPMYGDYTKMNRMRSNRWDKLMELDEVLGDKIKKILIAQQWIIITEPWCGDAAHIVPFLVALAKQNSLISYDIQLRDSEPFLINQYLTNGTKSIPKLIVRDDSGKDIFSWGPRPEGAQKLVDKMKAENADFEATKVALQNWYNNDKGKGVFEELKQLFN